MRKSSHIQKSFLISYVAVAIVALSSGIFANYFMEDVSADVLATSSGEKVTASSCKNNSPLLKSESTLTEQEIVNYGKNAKAWVIKTQQEKTFRIIIAVEQIAASGSGGEVKFTVALGNMNTFNYNDKEGKIWLITSDTSTPLEFLYDESNTLNLAPGKYWVGQKTRTIKNYSTTTVGAMMVNGTRLHRQGCIPSVINLSEAFDLTTSTATSSVSATSTSTSNISQATWSLPAGFSAHYVPSYYAGLKANEILNAGMYIYRFNIEGDKAWKIYTIEDAKTVLTPGVGYYVYNPGERVSVDLEEDSSYTETVNLRRGWNLLANSETGSIKLGEQEFPVINDSADNTCDTIDSCFTTKTISELVTEGRIYSKVFMIVDNTATDASEAFEIQTINAENIDSIQIPQGTPYWIYIAS